MSEPKIQRWECETNEFGDSDMQKNIIGNYVRYEDYVRLKTEVEKLRKGDERDMTAAYLYAAELAKDEIKRLKSEVERLTKIAKFAKDVRRTIDLASIDEDDHWTHALVDRYSVEEYDEAIAADNAAKEGKQS